MRTRATVCGLGVSLFAVFASGAVARTESQRITGWQRYVPRWTAEEVGPGERSIVLGVVQDSCASRDLRVKVTESRTRVTVSVSAESAIWSGPGVMSCPAPRLSPDSIRLRRRLAGRPIVGAGGGWSHGERSEETRVDGKLFEGNAVPGLVGFSPADARTALAGLSLRVLLGHAPAGSGLPRVRAQRPRAGTFLVLGDSVRLLLGRG